MITKCIKFFIFFLLSPFVFYAQNAATVLPENNNNINDTSKQRDLIDFAKKAIHLMPRQTKKPKKKKVYFSFLPISSNAPGADGRALVTNTTIGVYLGPKNTTSISSLTFTPYWNFNQRFGLPLRSSIWFNDNNWTVQGDTRFLFYPQYTWGLGNSHNDPDQILVDYKYIRFYQSILRKVRPYFFVGAGYEMDYHFNIIADDPNVNFADYAKYAYGTTGNSLSSGISLNILYDTRNNSINPLPGSYANIVFRINPAFLGSNDNWSSLLIDIRKYISLTPAYPNRQNTLAFWSYLWTSFSNKTPYLDLPSIGWDTYNRSGRGMEQNRYRGNVLFYNEVEYRRDITNNGLFGFVVFSNINTVSGSGGFFRLWHPAVGTGLRIKFNKGSNTNIGIDYGISKNYSSLTFSLGEVF